VGGTNPSLLRAMFAGAPCVAMNVPFHREVLGDAGLYFDHQPGVLAAVLRAIDAAPGETAARGLQARLRERAAYRWDAVVDAYASLFRILSATGDKPKTAAARLGEELYRPGVFAGPAAGPAQRRASSRRKAAS
jgi:hypothetical protein